MNAIIPPRESVKREMMNIPIIGIVENMSYLVCPDCGKKIYVFGQGKVDEIAGKHGIDKTAHIPIKPEIAALADAGKIEDAPDELLSAVAMFLAE